MVKHQPHFVSRAVHEYSCNQSIVFRESVRLLFQRNTSCQNVESENARTHSGCSSLADWSCQVTRSRCSAEIMLTIKSTVLHNTAQPNWTKNGARGVRN